MAIERTNFFTNPRPITSTTGWSVATATGGSGTTSQVLTVGPNSLNGFMRQTVTVPGTGAWGHFYTGSVPTAGAGTVREFSVWVRTSMSGTSAYIRAAFRLGAASEAYQNGVTVALAANTWTRLTVTATSAGSFDAARAWAYFTGTQTTGTYDMTQVMLEAPNMTGPFASYFDGGKPTDGVYNFGWNGTASASTSYARTVDAPVGVATTLVGSGSPKNVQVVVTGMTAGQVFSVQGATSDGYTWPVRGGSGVSTGVTLILGDIYAPLNVPITYAVTVNDVIAWTSTPITVTAPGKYLLQSLDGQLRSTPNLIDNGAPKSMDMRSAAFYVPGRSRPVVRMDIAGAGGGSLVMDTYGEQTDDLKALLSAGLPVVLRTDGDVRDLDAVDILMVTDVASELTGARIQNGNTRRWTLSYLLIDDPDPDAIIALSSWDDFDTVYSGQTWANFDTQWTGADWDEFDIFDWEGQA